MYLLIVILSHPERFMEHEQEIKDSKLWQNL